MSESESWTIQISAKLPDGTLINVRDTQVAGVVGNLEALAQGAEAIVDNVALLNAAHNAKAAVAAPQAAPAAPAAWTPPQGGQAAPAAGQPGPAPTCAHGARVYKNGVSKRGPWAGWSCTVHKDQGGCPMQWVN